MERIGAHAIRIARSAEAGPLLADLYLAQGQSSPSPVVIFIHGGIPDGLTPQPKDWGVFVSWCQLMAASGLTGVAFNHRMRWNNGFVPGSIENASDDLRDLVGYLVESASQLGVDASRIAMVAFSAGGPLLAAPLFEANDRVKCVAALYAYLGDATTPDVDAKNSWHWSAIRALNAKHGIVPPMFVASGGKDSALINNSIDDFVKRARELGALTEFMTHPHGVHGFDIENDDDMSRAIIRQAVKFIAGHLRK
jgi:acetyl esterase/lipase